MTYFVLILSVINILLFFIFLLKFKSIFSTDSILEKTTKRVDKIIAELNENAQRDIDLVSSSSRKLQKQLDEAEMQMQLFQEASQRLKDILAEVENKSIHKSFSIVENNSEIKYSNNSQKKSSNSINQKNQMSPLHKNYANAYSGNVNQNQQQPDLFSQESESVFIQNKDEVFVRSDGAAYKEIPLVVTKIIDEVPRNKNKDLRQNVIDLYNQGYSIEQITMELSCSVTEVQLIIDMI